jgi:hypothetical protein
MPSSDLSGDKSGRPRLNKGKLAARSKAARKSRPHIIRHQRAAPLTPADPVVLQSFADLQLARAVANQHRAQHFERRAWSYLMQYLTREQRD